MEHLLKNIVQDPCGPSINDVESRLDDDDGQKEFFSLLNRGNIAAFAYMKMKCKDWAGNRARIRMLHNFHETLFSIILTSSEQNFSVFCLFLETLYQYNSVLEDLMPSLCAEPTERGMRALNHMFNKYRTCAKSDVLYEEIIRNIELTKEIFKKAYLESQSDSVDILGMFYSLVCQDIHPFFEDNADKFFNTFCALLRIPDLQKDICEIFSLFVAKYPECIDMTKILETLLTLAGKTGFEHLKYSVLLDIVRRKNYATLMKFSTELLDAVRAGAYISRAEVEEMEADPLVYSREIIRGHDSQRGVLVEIIEHLKKVFGDEWAHKLVSIDFSTPMEEERTIFLCVATKLNIESVTDKCKAVARDGSSVKYICAIVFRYLLLLNMHVDVDPGHIDRESQSSFLAMEYLSRCIEMSVQPYSLESYSKPAWSGYCSVSENVGGAKYHSELFYKLINFLKGNIEDEFSSKLMRNVIKTDTRVITPETARFLCEFSEENVRNVNSPLAYTHLFDILGLVYMNTGDCTPALKLIQIVLSEEIFEVYLPALFLLAIIVLRSSYNFSEIVKIIEQEALWKTEQLLPGLICLTAALFKTGHCSVEQVDYIVKYLYGIDRHHAYTLLSIAPTEGAHSYLPAIQDDMEESLVLMTELVQKGLVMKDMYEKTYTQCLYYFTENFVSRRNARRVLRALMIGAKIVSEAERAYQILEKNKHNIGYENLPFSVIIAFEL